MLVVLISIKSLCQFLKICCTDLAILLWKFQNFMSGKFDCTGLMCTDMSCLSRYNALIWLQKCVNDNLIGLRSSCQQKDFCVLTAADLLNLLLG